MTTAFLKPVAGRRVLNHQRGFREMLPDGETVELDKDWRRMIADGDVVAVAKAPAKPAASKAPAPAKKTADTA